MLIIGSLILILSLLIYAMNDSIQLTRTIIITKKVKKDIKFAVLSDFHCGDSSTVLNYLEKIKPDAILIPGDLIDENMKLDSVIELLKGIQKWPSYYVSGNHEFKKGRYYKCYDELKKILNEYGIVNIDNDSKEVIVSNQKVWIGGVQDHCADKSKNPDVLDQMNLNSTCSKLNKNLFSILLMHRPEQYKLIEQYEVDLVVSGHAHGGQWRLPGINGLFAPQQGLFPERAGGEYQLGKGIHLVSRGLAHYWFLPRLCNHREINVIAIQSE